MTNQPHPECLSSVPVERRAPRPGASSSGVMTGRSLLLPDGTVVVLPAKAETLWAAMDTLKKARRQNGKGWRDEDEALLLEYREAATLHAAERRRSAGGGAARKSAEVASLCSCGQQDELLTAGQIAELLGCTDRWVRQLMSDYEIPPRALTPKRWSPADVSLLRQRREEY